MGLLKEYLKGIFRDESGVGVVEMILILVDIYIMGERYIYCEWR